MRECENKSKPSYVRLIEIINGQRVSEPKKGDLGSTKLANNKTNQRPVPKGRKIENNIINFKKKKDHGC